MAVHLVGHSAHRGNPGSGATGAAAPADEGRQGQDRRLILTVRGGDLAAYGELYESHVTAARKLARQLARSSIDADDLVAEAFSKVLDMLRVGRGPDFAFRSYLLTVLRHTAYDTARKERKVELSADLATTVDPELISLPFQDTVVDGLEHGFVAKAFARLPQRWQAVLRYTELEGRSPTDLAPELGITASGVSALAYRAREGLRQAYLQAHLADVTAKRCAPVVERLGAWARGGLPKREVGQVDEHLARCDSCRALSVELAEINQRLPRRRSGETVVWRKGREASGCCGSAYDASPVSGSTCVELAS